MSPYSSKMKAAVVASLLASMLTALPAAYAAEPAASSKSAPAVKTDLQLAFDKGAVEGYPNDSDLHGSRPVTRAELVTMLNRAAKLAPGDNKLKPFPDLEAWQLQAVMNAAAAGIVSGNDKGLFEPGRTVTREELAVLVVKAMTKGGEPKVNQNVLNYYKDASSISEWAKPYAAYAVFAGLFEPKLDGAFDPKGSVTREEASRR